MGRKSRNKNKGDRDDFVLSSSSSKKPHDFDESVTSETESYATNSTFDFDLQSVTNGEENEGNEDAFDLMDNFAEYLENATNKRISIRVAALDLLCRFLTRCSVADELNSWKATLIDVIEKGLRRTDEELSRAAVLAALVSLQLGSEINDEMEPVVSIMRDISIDPARSESARIYCINSVALCSYLSITQADSLCCTLNALRTVWTSTKTNALLTQPFNSAAVGWALLICQAGRRSLEAALQDQPKLCSYLDGTQVSMRMSAAEAIGVLYEAATATIGPDYRFPNHSHLLEMLEALITDSLKFRAKKDRRLQRSTVRHVYSAIKNQEVPPVQVKFGSEFLSLDTCGEKLLYSLICDVLRGGMNIHLKTNSLLRELFDLGPVQEELPARIPKLQRLAIQNAVNKERDIKRSKQRDKRSC